MHVNVLSWLQGLCFKPEILPQGVKERVRNQCVIQSVPLIYIYIQHAWDELWIHHYPEQEIKKAEALL